MTKKCPLCAHCIHGWLTQQAVPYYAETSESHDPAYATPQEKKAKPNKIIQKEFKGLCFWPSKKLKGMSPYEVGNVKQCSRYEEDEIKMKKPKK